ncbi:hypothetical protein IW262DRAFT_1279619 [Armillaria fumosa]|nr:hypothetical protein IW262DRAFT_1279619 [Armillaria fumosa]
MTTSPPSVLILALAHERFMYSPYTQLMESMKACATVTQVETKGEFAREMKLSPPTVVIAIDAGISEPENSVVLQRLLQYTRGGGTTICCCNFSNAIHNARVKTFFATCGLPWDLGSYFRTTAHLNQAATGMVLEGLPESYSLKSMTLLNVARRHRIYAPSPTSRVESNVFGPNAIPIDVNECPCAYGPVGRGWLGYVGDINNEDGSTRVIMAMTRCLPQSAVVPDRSNRSYAFIISNGQPTEVQGVEDPNQPTIRYPPRPREDEVEARAAKRAESSKQKSEQAKLLKDKGNTCFQEGKYHAAIEYYNKAISTYGPRPAYYANIAAACLKLGLYIQAADACDEALEYDPNSIKLRYRRGIARRSMFAFKLAMEDFKACAKLAPEDPQFQKEIAQTRKESDQRRATGAPDFNEEDDPQYLSDDDSDDCSDFDPPLDYPARHIQTDSDSSDFEHDGNGKPCRAYNHEECSQGSKCALKHSPDEDTTRDQLGRNVCNVWLIRMCTSGSACPYAHSKEYLPESGWWNERGMAESLDLIQSYMNMTPEELRNSE